MNLTAKLTSIPAFSVKDSEAGCGCVLCIKAAENAEPLLEIDLPWVVVRAICEWQERNNDLADLDTFIEDIEDGSERVSSMTIEQIRNARSEIVEYIQSERNNSSEWRQVIRDAICEYAWDHKEE